MTCIPALGRLGDHELSCPYEVANTARCIDSIIIEQASRLVA